MRSLRVKAVINQGKQIYRDLVLRRPFSGRLFKDLLFSDRLFSCFLFFLRRSGKFFSPGAKLGGRIDTPGIEVGVIQSAIVSSCHLMSYYIAAREINKGYC
jgi:hypothetical protein